ncbi:MAG: class I SAM-dependent methyltransferase [Clostridia bacterium]|nr:class I SAM-dependent methyltransferase [Clostridia bacterium]
MAYTDLAQVYDKLMDEVDYNEWVDYIITHIEKAQAPGKVLLDLGCGTGSICIPLAQKGYWVTGIDISAEMLTQAEQKARAAGVNINFFQQDIRELVLDFQVDIVIATFDIFNYIIEKQELIKVFQKIHGILKDGGILIFDVNTPYKLEKVLGENVFTYNTEELVYIWESFYERKTKICEMDLTFFSLDQKTGKYIRFDETHLERAYEENEIKEMLIKNGFSVQGIYGQLSFFPPTENEERVFFVAKKQNSN